MLSSDSTVSKDKEEKEAYRNADKDKLKSDHTSARSEAWQFLTDLRKPHERVRTAKELHRYISVSLKNEDPQYVEEFISILDCKDNAQSVIYESIYSQNPEDRKVGIFLIVCLADSVDFKRIVFYSQMLFKALTFPKNNDGGTMDLTAAALIYLILISKSYAADLLEKCLDQCLEWLQEPNEDMRRLAAALLARELAMFTPTSFFLRANVFFTHIFGCLRDPKPTIRIAALNALHAALSITSQREAKQKTLWYTKCLEEAYRTVEEPDICKLSKEDRLHSMLLVLNELLRIADSSFEKVNLLAEGGKFEPKSIDNPIEWLVQPRISPTVESHTAKKLVHDGFSKIVQSVRASDSYKNPHVQSVLLEIYPRLSAWDECTDDFRATMFTAMRNTIAGTRKENVSVAMRSMGLLLLQRPEMFLLNARKVLLICKDMIGPRLKEASTVRDAYSRDRDVKDVKSKRKLVDSSVFTFLALFVRSYKEQVANDIRSMLDQLLGVGLCEGLTVLLHEITQQIPSLLVDVQDGLLKVLYKRLTNQNLPDKIEPPRKPLLPQHPIEVSQSEEIELVLALETLGSFDFQRHSLQMCMQYVAEGYLVAESVNLRLAAVRCCTAMLRPFVKVYGNAHREHRQWVLELIHGVLRCLVSVGVMDPKLEVRLCVFKCFYNSDQQFLSHLAQPHMLELIFMSLYDEKLEMQEAAVCLLCRLSELNPALVLPRLRRVLLETLSQLTNSGQARLEQHSARLLVQIARQCPKFVRPYLGPLITTLLPKLRLETKHVDVTTQVLNAISELCIVGGSEVVKSIDPMFSKLTQLIQDASSSHRREAALQCIGQMCRATAYVVDPYKDYPTLLDDLLRLLKTEMSSSMRRQAIKVLGILGALDPYTHKVFTGAVQSANSITMAVSLPVSGHDRNDPRTDIIQWFNYEKCTLEEFYPAITIANLVVMVQDEAYTQYYKEITEALLKIFMYLGETYPQYVQQVVPRLIEVTKSCKGRQSHREFFLQQLAALVSIIKGHAKPYLKDLFVLIAEAWNAEHAAKDKLVGVLERIGTALGQDFSPHIAELIPYLLTVVQTDRDPKRKTTAQALSCVRSLSPCLTPHLQLVLPPVLAIADDKTVPMEVRQSALDSVLHLSRSDDMADYAPRLMQTWQKCIEFPPLQDQLYQLLLIIVNQMWKHFEVFKRSVELKLKKHNLEHGQYYDQYLSSVNKASLSLSYHRPSNSIGTQITNQHGGPLYHRHRILPAPISVGQVPSGTNKQRVNKEFISKAWAIDSLSSKEDWTQWLIKLRLAVIRHGSSAAIRAAAPLSEEHQHLAKGLFNAAFMSVWTELDEHEQDRISGIFSEALNKSDHPDVRHAILNLAEFMDHSEKGPLPIRYERLRASAEDSKAYAKALRYTEKSIQRKQSSHLDQEECQYLITYANKLNVPEEAKGVARFVEHGQPDSTVKMEGKWYEKLNEWDCALDAYEDDRRKAMIVIENDTGSEEQSKTRSDVLDEIATNELRCLEALGRWSEMNERARTIKKRDHKVMVTAARGAWAVGDFDSMASYVKELNENSQHGSFLRAVLAVKNSSYDTAIGFIDKVRDMYDSELTTMANESYERAYGAMIQVQQLAELEEAIEYKLRPERRPRIALLWSRRMQGCRQNIEQWQRLLMLRSLVLNDQEMHPLRVKFASLCRQQGKQSMCRSVLRNLLNLPANAELETASAHHDKPQLVLALCKQLFLDEKKDLAVKKLDALSKHLDRTSNQSYEAGRIAAKVNLKLGAWYEEKPIMDMMGPPRNAGVSQYAVTSGPVRASTDPDIGGISIRDCRQTYMTSIEVDKCWKVLNCYIRATEFDPKWHKAWHKLAVAHLQAMNREKELAKISAQNMRLAAGGGLSPLGIAPVLSVNSPLLPDAVYSQSSTSNGLMMQQAMPPQMTLAPLSVPPPLMNPFPPQALSPLSMPPPAHHYLSSHQPEIPAKITHAVAAVHCFAKALVLAPGSRLEDTLRLMQIWFEFGDEDLVYLQLSQNIKGLPVETWLEVVPQLMARLDSNDKMTMLIEQVIHEISKTKPQALVYALTVAAKSSNHKRAQNARSMLTVMKEMHPTLVDEAQMVSDELVRCAILWHELWHDALDDASRLYFQEKNYGAMMAVLLPMHKMLDTGVGNLTLKEQSFHQTYYNDLSDAYKFCVAYDRNKNQKELSQAWEIYCQIFKRIAGQIRQLTSLDLNYISPKLKKARDLELAVPGTYDPNSPVISISSVGTHLQVISSKQRPRKMSIRGSNGLEYVFLLKGHEDPRQDERVMQFFGLINTLLVNNAETCRRNLTIQRYSITALSQNSSLIGWVPNCDTIHSMIRDYRDKKRSGKSSLSTEHKTMQLFAPDSEQLTLLQKLQTFDYVMNSSDGDDLREILWQKSPSSEVWFERRTNYTRSVACMSMVGYILGLGDRHPSNLMLDRLTGKIIHIDFGDCFDVAMTREKFPEKVPFRLTRMIIKAMGVTGLDGAFQQTCEIVLRLIRANKESLLAVLEAFVYDPVINWRLLDGTKKDPGANKDAAKKPPTQQQEAPRTVSEQVMEKIKQKIAGREFGTEDGVDVVTQIALLVEQATMAENLCQAYVGWCPFW